METPRNNIIFKAKRGEDLRRWTAAPDTVNFDSVASHVSGLFGVPAEAIIIRYQDDEADWITLGSDADLAEAISVVTSSSLPLGTKPILRLSISDRVVNRPADLSSTEAQAAAEAATAEALAKAQLAADKLQEETAKAAIFAEKSIKAVQKVAKKAGMDVHAGLASALPHIASVLDHEAKSGKLPPPIADMLGQMASAMTPRERPEEEVAVWHGVSCDASGMFPLVGPRFKKRGENYDLCEAEFNKLDDEAKAAFIRMDRPCQPWRPRCMRTDHKSQKPQARFVEHVNIPDNTEILPGTEFVKIWKLRNSGTEPWPETTSLIHVGGDKFEGESSAPVNIVAPGDETEVAVSLVAPHEPGRYVSYWRLAVKSADGSVKRKFGQRVWVQVVIVRENGTVEFEESEQAIHLNVACDISEMCPIVGTRYHKKGEDYDLCEAEFLKLDAETQTGFEMIAWPGQDPVDLGPEPEEDTEETNEVTDELEARHGWDEPTIAMVQNSQLSGLIETMKLGHGKLMEVSAALEPIFRVPQEHLGTAVADIGERIQKNLQKGGADMVVERLPKMVENTLKYMDKVVTKAMKAQKKLMAKAVAAEKKAERKAEKAEKKAEKAEMKAEKKDESTFVAAMDQYAQQGPPVVPPLKIGETNTSVAEAPEEAPEEAAAPLQTPRCMEEAVAEIGIATDDLSASIIADMDRALAENAEQIAEPETVPESEIPPPAPQPEAPEEEAPPAPTFSESDFLATQLVDMGFCRDGALAALAETSNDLDAAISKLLESAPEPEAAAPAPVEVVGIEETLPLPAAPAVPVTEIVEILPAAPAVTEVVEITPESEDVAPPKWEAEWDDLLVELVEMGFEDETLNRSLLANSNGNVKDAVKELVEQERAARAQI